MRRPTRSRTLRAAAALAVLAPLGLAAGQLPARAETAAPYLVGTGVYDITGAVAETGMFGYAANQEADGLQERLYSHAYVIGDPATGKRVVFVSADLGAVFQSVKLGVTRKLAARYGSLYTDANVLISATHTHVGTAGLSHHKLYQAASNDKALYGYDQKNLDTVIDGIVASIARAHDSLAPGSIRLAEGDLTGATKNRSLPAYQANTDAGQYPTSVNTRMTQLDLARADGTPVGLVNWFAVHPTSFSMKWTKISGDNKGLAQYVREQDHGSRPTDGSPFVASFAQSDEGDVVSTQGNAYSAPGYQGSPDELTNAEVDGWRQAQKSRQLSGQGTPLAGGVDSRFRWVNLNGYPVDAKYTQGAGPQRLCSPARGFSFAAGGENGPSNIPGIYEGMTKGTFNVFDTVNQVDTSAAGSLTRLAFASVAGILGADDPCQAQKPVLIPTGAWGWVPTVLPVQILRVGDLAIVGVPGEPTTMSGRRIRETVAEQLRPAGVTRVVIAGLANDYTGYVATPEEFAKQHYEGASTEFGPYELGAFQQELAGLAGAMATGSPAAPSATTNDPGPSLSRPGVVFDDKPLTEQFGQVLAQPAASYTAGQTASAQFRGGHPKNDYRTMRSFLEVQRLVDGQWVRYLDDHDWDTTYTWKREGVAYSRTTVEWRIRKGTPAGTYRLVQTGDWKNGWTGRISPYTGTSAAFTVS